MQSDTKNRITVVKTDDSEYFIIARLHRDDVAEVFEHADKLTDRQMENLARKLGDRYIEHGGFWDDLEDLSCDLEVD